MICSPSQVSHWSQQRHYSHLHSDAISHNSSKLWRWHGQPGIGHCPNPCSLSLATGGSSNRLPVWSSFYQSDFPSSQEHIDPLLPLNVMGVCGLIGAVAISLMKDVV